MILGAEKKIPFISGKHLVLNMQKSLDFHPNGMIFKAGFSNGEILEKDYYFCRWRFCGTQEDNSIESHCIRTPYPCHKGEDISKYCEKLGVARLSDLVYINEEAWRTKEETRSEALYIWQQIKTAFTKALIKKAFYQEDLM